MKTGELSRHFLVGREVVLRLLNWPWSGTKWLTPKYGISQNRDLIVLRYRLPYTYWGGIWDLLTFNVAILSTLLLYRLWRGALKATYFPFDLFSRISERLLLLKLHIGKWLLLKIKDVNTSLAKSGFWDFYWNSFFLCSLQKRDLCLLQ